MIKKPYAFSHESPHKDTLPVLPTVGVAGPFPFFQIPFLWLSRGPLETEEHVPSQPTVTNGETWAGKEGVGNGYWFSLPCQRR